MSIKESVSVKFIIIYIKYLSNKLDKDGIYS